MRVVDNEGELFWRASEDPRAIAKVTRAIARVPAILSNHGHKHEFSIRTAAATGGIEWVESPFGFEFKCLAAVGLLIGMIVEVRGMWRASFKWVWVLFVYWSLGCYFEGTKLMHVGNEGEDVHAGNERERGREQGHGQ